MLRNHFERALARAATESSFRARLLTDPAETLGEYGLAADDAVRIERVCARSLPEFAAVARRQLWRDSWETPGLRGAEAAGQARLWRWVIDYIPPAEQPY
ncbi:MAG TPA: hypothetical protein VKQ36_04480 [Ktedonobacterales bacterium]|nr:hypothetical protein [Ktedonobacterales bacterium]